MCTGDDQTAQILSYIDRSSLRISIGNGRAAALPLELAVLVLEAKRTTNRRGKIDAIDPLLPSGPPIIGTAQTLSEPLSGSLQMAMIQRAGPVLGRQHGCRRLAAEPRPRAI